MCAYASVLYLRIEMYNALVFFAASQICVVEIFTLIYLLLLSKIYIKVKNFLRKNKINVSDL